MVPWHVSELWAYQTSILRAVENCKGSAWVPHMYDRKYQRKALAHHDLNWSACNARLHVHVYNEAFTGCKHCLSTTHSAWLCPANPDSSTSPTQPSHPTSVAPQSSGNSIPTGNQQEMCRNFNEGRCKSLCYRYMCIYLSVVSASTCIPGCPAMAARKGCKDYVPQDTYRITTPSFNQFLSRSSDPGAGRYSHPMSH